MSKKTLVLMTLVLLFSLVAAQCGTPATEAPTAAPAATEAPATAAPAATEAPATEAPATEAAQPTEEMTEAPATEAAAPKPYEDIKIGMSVLNLANPFFVQLSAGAQEEADRLGVELVVSDPKEDVNAQVTELENFINGGFDGFVVTAIDPAAIAPVAKEALDKGMYVVAHTSDLGEENQTALVWAVEYDMGHTLGLQAGEWAKAHIPEGETLKVGVLNYRIIPQVIQREEGILAGIREMFGENVEVVGSELAGDPTQGLTAAETWLQANPDMQMIVGINDGGALGAYQAVIAADKNDPGTFFVGGIDATPEALAAIQEGGAYQATVDQQPKEMGALCVRTLVAAIRGEPYESVNAIKLAPVNASNVAEFIGGDAAALAEADTQPVATPEGQTALVDMDLSGIKIGMSVLNLANPFFVQLSAGAQEEADRLGVELVVSDPKEDVNAQVTELENFINGGFDGFVVTAIDPAAIAPVAKEALDKGMYVVAHTSDLGEENQTALVWAVEYDMGHTLGLQAGEWAKAHIPEGETLKVGVLNYRIIPQVIQREEGILAGIREMFGENVEVVGSELAGDPTQGLTAAETWLQANPDMQMIVGINDGGALGAYQAVIAADKNDPGTFFVGGIDATPEALAAIQEGGAYQATVDQQPKEMGALCVFTLVSAIVGQPYEKVNAIKLAPVNASNVAEFIK